MFHYIGKQLHFQECVSNFEKEIKSYNFYTQTFQMINFQFENYLNLIFILKRHFFVEKIMIFISEESFRHQKYSYFTSFYHVTFLLEQEEELALLEVGKEGLFVTQISLNPLHLGCLECQLHVGDLVFQMYDWVNILKREEPTRFTANLECHLTRQIIFIDRRYFSTCQNVQGASSDLKISQMFLSVTILSRYSNCFYKKGYNQVIRDTPFSFDNPQFMILSGL